MDNTKTQTPPQEPPYMRAAGRLPHTLTNDYLFKALLQKNETVLKGLVCSLLHLRQQQITSIEIKNPILLGEALTEDYDSKTFILDINILLNDDTIINLEMQVVDYGNWPERSLSYLYRSFDQLQSGDDYLTIKPVIHISFLDYVLFPEHPEFYAGYRIMNVKTHHIYSDKIAIHVVDLNHIELATPEDREWGIDHWASLFKATTWEELKAMAQGNQVMAQAVQTMYELTADEAIRQQALARERQIKEYNTLIRMKERAFQERDEAVAKLDSAVAMISQQLAQRDQQLAQRDQQITQQSKQITQQSKQITQQSKQITQRDQQITQQSKQITQRDQQITQQSKQIAELLREIQLLKEGGK